MTVENLRSGHTTSCGCSFSEAPTTAGTLAIGTRFGRWSIASAPIWEPIPERPHAQRAFYDCICDCGTKRRLREHNILYRSRSCGCARAESIAALTGTKRTGNYLTVQIKVGTRFQRWTTLEPPRLQERSNGTRHSVVNCVCDCGQTRTVTANNLLNGTSGSCGCLQRDIMSEMLTTHGVTTAKRERAKEKTASATPAKDADSIRLYTIWAGIKDRCGRPAHPSWHRYGGRGVNVCEQWRNDFQAFRGWALDHGYADGLECDRVDPDAGYNPENCRWITKRANIEHMRKAWDDDLDQRLIAEAKRRGIGPYDLIAEAVRAHLTR
ncbi:hypothetical protein ACOZE3_32905 [Streptomyces cinereoruber]|uniref:hypothetical protein n=1 Tax=Streptomyces cinereoruber TaxID=67260 RepID=UPI003BF50171